MRSGWVIGAALALIGGCAFALGGGPAEGAPGDPGVRETFVVAPGSTGEATLRCPAGSRLTADRMSVSPATAEVVQLSSMTSDAPGTVAVSVVNADAIEVAVAVSATCVTPG